jgi:hypothetical protein
MLWRMEVGTGGAYIRARFGMTYQEEKRCCTVCERKRKCHICGAVTQLACSDCAINLGVTVYVCSRTECRDKHEERCSGAAARCAQVEADRDNALANADFWERELNNFRRNAAHRAEQLAKEKVEAAECEVTKLMNALKARTKGLREAEAELKEQNRWIPVEEKLPEVILGEFEDRYSAPVLMLDDARNCWIGFYDHTDKHWVMEQGLEDSWPMKDGIYSVTHWRPLPEPPAPSREGDNGPK